MGYWYPFLNPPRSRFEWVFCASKQSLLLIPINAIQSWGRWECFESWFSEVVDLKMSRGLIIANYLGLVRAGLDDCRVENELEKYEPRRLGGRIQEFLEFGSCWFLIVYQWWYHGSLLGYDIPWISYHLHHCELWTRSAHYPTSWPPSTLVRSLTSWSQRNWNGHSPTTEAPPTDQGMTYGCLDPFMENISRSCHWTFDCTNGPPSWTKKNRLKDTLATEKRQKVPLQLRYGPGKQVERIFFMNVMSKAALSPPACPCGCRNRQTPKYVIMFLQGYEQ